MIYNTKPTIKEVQSLILPIKDNTVEDIWIPLWNFKDINPMTEDETNFLETLLTAPFGKLLGLATEITSKPEFRFNSDMIWVSMKNRFNINLDLRSNLWIWYHGFRPGILVMIYAYLKYRLYQLNLNELDFETFNLRIFPNGFPTEQFFEYLWDCQKIFDPNNRGSDNLLDYKNAYKSFIPSE